MVFTTACLLTWISGHNARLFFICCFSPTLTIYPSLFSHQTHGEEISKDWNERLRLERDLEEASRRLAMAHQDIRRLTNELDETRNNNQNTSGMLEKVVYVIRVYAQYAVINFVCPF